MRCAPRCWRDSASRWWCRRSSWRTPSRGRSWSGSRRAASATPSGSSFGGVKGREQVPQLVQRALDGEIDVAPFVSHRIALDDVNRAFELMHAQDGIRSVIDF
jgi:hypothetical protein